MKTMHLQDSPLLYSAADGRLAEAALWIAREQYAQLDVQRYLARIEFWAEDILAKLPAGASAEERVLALNEYLFQQTGLRGNDEAYFDPRNSFLNEVMDRGLGLPITLSIIYLEVGKRIGLPLEGVSFPGHFLVKLPVSSGSVVLDPYSGGASLEEADLELMLRQVDKKARLDRSSLTRLLEGASEADILIRMMRNLKGIYWQRKEFEQVYWVQNVILAMSPNLAVEVRDRGLALERIECHRAALEDFQHYLELAPLADDADSVRARVIELQGRTLHLH